MGRKWGPDQCLDTGLVEELDRMLADPTITVVVIDSLFTSLTTNEKANDAGVMSDALTVGTARCCNPSFARPHAYHTL